MFRLLAMILSVYILTGCARENTRQVTPENQTKPPTAGSDNANSNGKDAPAPSQQTATEQLSKELAEEFLLGVQGRDKSYLFQKSSQSAAELESIDLIMNSVFTVQRFHKAYSIVEQFKDSRGRFFYALTPQDPEGAHEAIRIAATHWDLDLFESFLKEIQQAKQISKNPSYHWNTTKILMASDRTAQQWLNQTSDLQKLGLPWEAAGDLALAFKSSTLSAKEVATQYRANYLWIKGLKLHSKEHSLRAETKKATVLAMTSPDRYTKYVLIMNRKSQQNTQFVKAGEQESQRASQDNILRSQAKNRAKEKFTSEAEAQKVCPYLNKSIMQEGSHYICL